jgi:hypothetical protein
VSGYSRDALGKCNRRRSWVSGNLGVWKPGCLETLGVWKPWVSGNLGVWKPLRDYQARLGKPFLHDVYLAELTTLRDQLKGGLSGATPEPERQAGQSVAEIAEQIKALKAANTIEAVPERDRHKQSSAEEPITARIRRRAEAVPAPDRDTESEVAPNSDGIRSQGSTQNPSLDPSRSFGERIVLERQRKDDGPSLP